LEGEIKRYNFAVPKEKKFRVVRTITFPEERESEQRERARDL
jgi:hypothetical protein